MDNAANNPYVIVGVFEGRCSYEQYPPIPRTPILAKAYEEGILDASFAQIVSFASFYQTSFRVEVPLRHKLEDGRADPALDSQTAPRRGSARETPVDKGPSPRSSGEATERPGARTHRAEANAGEETTEEESYVPATGQGCFSFEMSLLQRAAQTFAKRSVGCEMAAYWVSYDHLEEKLASFVQAPRVRRHPPRPASGTLRNRIPLHRKIRQKEALCCDRRARPDCAQLGTTRQPSRPYGLSCNDLSLPYNMREAGAEIAYFRQIDRTVELPDTEGTSREAAVQTKPQTSASSRQ